MGKYYCDYCDVFLVSESPSVRKAHNSGRNHLTNVRDYYSSLGHDKAQIFIDEITRMFEGGPNSNSRGGGGGVNSNSGGGGGHPGANSGGPPNHSHGPMRPPFQPGNSSGPNVPAFPPAMLALMNGSNVINSTPGSAPPPMRFAGPPIMNNTSSMSQPPPGLSSYPGGPHPPGPPPNPTSQSTTPSLVGGMNPDRARQLGLL